MLEKTDRQKPKLKLLVGGLQQQPKPPKDPTTVNLILLCAFTFGLAVTSFSCAAIYRESRLNNCQVNVTKN